MPDELDVEDTKIKINNFLFMNLRETITLAEMELIAMDILDVFISHDKKRIK